MNFRKAVMIGCGYVGAASVFSLMQSGLFSEIALIDVDKEKAEGEAMDKLAEELILKSIKSGDTVTVSAKDGKPVLRIRAAKK